MIEEIIIDGVNVAGCEYYTTMEDCDGIHDLCEQLDDYCSIKKNCYFKQLKRLEQENERLKDELNKTIKEYNYFNKACVEANTKNIELQRENKELKEWKERVVKLFESACRCKYLNEETDICSYANEKCININKCVYKYQELSNNYRSALEEIREIVISAFAKQRPYKEDFAEIENVVNKILNKG